MACDRWRRCTVGNIAASVRNALVGGPFGSNLTSSDYVPLGVPVIRGQNLGLGRWVEGEFAFVTIEKADALSSNLARPGDVIFTQRGTLGQVALVPENRFEQYLVSQSQMKLTVDSSQADAIFLYYVFQSEEQQDYIKRNAIQTGVPHTNLGILRDTPLFLPPLTQQRAIAHILGTLDDKIELNRRMNETLEAMARALFKSWFVDFEPVRAKAQGRDTGLPKEIADLFPDRFQDSELGEIPEGWTTLKIEDIAERVAIGPFGSSIKVATFVAQGVPIISGQHLRGFMLEDNSFNFITHEHAEALKNAMVRRGDVVFTHAGNIGQVAFVPENSRYDQYVISQRQFYMRCDLTRITPSFVTYYFKMPEGQHQLLANTSSSGVPSIARPVTFLRGIKIPVPPRRVLNAFDQFVRPIHVRYRSNMDNSNTLADIRDALLPKLLSGEIRVKDAEKFLRR